jgi:hypothetical protein
MGVMMVRGVSRLPNQASQLANEVKRERIASRNVSIYAFASPLFAIAIPGTICNLCAEPCQSIVKSAFAFRVLLLGHLSYRRHYGVPTIIIGHSLASDDSHFLLHKHFSLTRLLLIMASACCRDGRRATNGTAC